MKRTILLLLAISAMPFVSAKECPDGGECCDGGCFTEQLWAANCPKCPRPKK